MPVFLLPQDDPDIIIMFGEGSPHLVVSEQHEKTVLITDHPVERGAPITDHVRVENESLTLELFVTNTPITRDQIKGRGDSESIEIRYPQYHPPFDGTPGAIFRRARELGEFAVDQILGAQPPPSTSIEVLIFPEPFDVVREIQDQLTGLQAKATLFTVLTASRTYEDMLISRVGVPRDQPGGATFQVDLRAIIVVATATVKAPKPLEKRGVPQVAKGSQATKPAEQDAKPTSLALKAIALLTGKAS